MRTAEEITERISSLETAKMCLLFPIQEFVSGAREILSEEEYAIQWNKQTELQAASVRVTLESLNAEIAALTWVLDGRSSTAFSIGGAIMDTGSTDIAAAWGVVEKLISNGWQFSLNVVDSQPEAMFWKGPTPKTIDERRWALEQMAGVGFGSTWVHADTPPLTVCLAALKAVGAEVPA